MLVLGMPFFFQGHRVMHFYAAVTWVHGSQVQRFPTKELRDETESHVRRA